jgi:hypothetical protein
MGKPSSTSKTISRKTLALKEEDDSSLSNPAQIESQMQRLLEQNRHLNEKLEHSLKTVSKLRRQRGALLDLIASKRRTAGDYDSSNDDDSSAFDEDEELAELSEPQPSSSSESEEEEGFATPPQVFSPATPAPYKPVLKARKNRHRLIDVARDDAGRPILPLQLGSITVISLGQIDTSPAYHNNRYIFPVGYKVQRVYKSMIKPGTHTNYTCTVKEGTTGPKFCVEPADDPDNPVEKDTPSAAWTTVMKIANHDKLRQNFAVSGPEYFGMSHPTIVKLIQELPGAEQCENYAWQDFSNEQALPPPQPSKRQKIAS